MFSGRSYNFWWKNVNYIYPGHNFLIFPCFLQYPVQIPVGLMPLHSETRQLPSKGPFQHSFQGIAIVFRPGLHGCLDNIP